ncbi:MAG: malonyl-ACP O-methyltransferase BioC [Halopseudomonas sp.]
MTYTYTDIPFLPEQHNSPQRRSRSINPSSIDIDKATIAASFSKAAPSYDAHAQLQQLTGNLLLASIKPQRYPRIVDLGCGTGHFTSKLKDLFQPKQLVGIDIAEGMLEFAKGKNPQLSVLWIAADAEELPLLSSNFSLVFSNLSIQWCNQLERMLAEVHRILRPGGKFVFSTLGPSSLWELKESWHSLDPQTHVNQFIDRESLETRIQQAGFAHVELHDQEIVLHYQHLKQLLQDLKGIGAHNMNRRRPASLTGKQKFAKLTEYYENFRTINGNLSATYQIYSGTLTK